MRFWWDESRRICEFLFSAISFFSFSVCVFSSGDSRFIFISVVQNSSLVCVHFMYMSVIFYSCNLDFCFILLTTRLYACHVCTVVLYMVSLGSFGSSPTITCFYILYVLYAYMYEHLVLRALLACRTTTTNIYLF